MCTRHDDLRCMSGTRNNDSSCFFILEQQHYTFSNKSHKVNVNRMLNFEIYKIQYYLKYLIFSTVLLVEQFSNLSIELLLPFITFKSSFQTSHTLLVLNEPTDYLQQLLCNILKWERVYRTLRFQIYKHYANILRCYNFHFSPLFSYIAELELNELINLVKTKCTKLLLFKRILCKNFFYFIKHFCSNKHFLS